jgi:hypothetical protein
MEQIMVTIRSERFFWVDIGPSEKLLVANPDWECSRGRCIAKGLAVLAAPGIQGVLRDAGFAGQPRDGDVVEWPHFGNDAHFEFFRMTARFSR